LNYNRKVVERNVLPLFEWYRNPKGRRKRMRKILHIDMDAFFASVEQMDHPHLRGKPIIVGGKVNQRGVVATCSYEARAFGVRSAMPTSKAIRLCPKAIIVPPNFERYRELSLQIREIFHRYTPLVEPMSIDEAYLDVTENSKNQNSATIIAREIQEAIYKEVGLTCSVGVSFNKGYSESEIVGETFVGEYIDATSIERNKYNILGDKFEVFKTKILKDNKFPEIEGENFLSEIILWTRIAYQGYKIRWYNEIIYICDYLPDGLTRDNDEILRKNYRGNALRIREQVALANIGLKAKLGYYSKYYQLRKGSEKFSTICKEISANPMTVVVAVVIRKLLRR